MCVDGFAAGVEGWCIVQDPLSKPVVVDSGELGKRPAAYLCVTRRQRRSRFFASARVQRVAPRPPTD
jgi:hypothetical protein